MQAPAGVASLIHMPIPAPVGCAPRRLRAAWTPLRLLLLAHFLRSTLLDVSSRAIQAHAIRLRPDPTDVCRPRRSIAAITSWALPIPSDQGLAPTTRSVSRNIPQRFSATCVRSASLGLTICGHISEPTRTSGHLSALYVAKPSLDSMIANDTKGYTRARRSSFVRENSPAADNGAAVADLPGRTLWGVIFVQRRGGSVSSRC